MKTGAGTMATAGIGAGGPPSAPGMYRVRRRREVVVAAAPGTREGPSTAEAGAGWPMVPSWAGASTSARGGGGGEGAAPETGAGLVAAPGLVFEAGEGEGASAACAPPEAREAGASGSLLDGEGPHSEGSLHHSATTCVAGMSSSRASTSSGGGGANKGSGTIGLVGGVSFTPESRSHHPHSHLPSKGPPHSVPPPPHSQ